MADLRALRTLLAERRVPLDEVLSQAVDRVTQALDADRGTLYLVDHARQEVVSRTAVLPEIGEIRLAMGEGVAGHVAAEDVLLNVPFGTQDPRFAARIDASTGYTTRSLLAVPVHDPEGLVIGVLQVLNRRSAPGFDVTCEQLLLDLASEVSGLLATSSLASALRPGQAHTLDFHFNGIVGSSEGMREVTRRIALAAPTESTVLIRGETGTGKELVARALHDSSGRAERAFVKVDCAALPPSLIENELFGHERGAYTGADRATDGQVAAAEGGTLFLDEVGELPMSVQGRLLRLLQDRTYVPVGATQARRADVRFVAATHRALEADVAEGRLRRDLYFRLKVVELRVPSLQSRGPQDLDRLISHFIHSESQRHGRPITLTAASRASLHAHSWPGNVRELEHAIEAAAILCGGQPIEPAHLSLVELTGARTGAFSVGIVPMERLTRAYAQWALERHHGNRSATARALEIGRNTLARKLED